MSNSHTLISARAYDIWENEGRPAERAGVHWLQAERDVLAAFARSIRDVAVADKPSKPKRAPRKKAAPRRIRKAA